MSGTTNTKFSQAPAPEEFSQATSSKEISQAVLLCAGKAKRLRPYSHIVPKSSLPFLNLPLLAYSWFHLEALGGSRFLLNSHLFPLQLEKSAQFLSKTSQKVECFFEPEPLGVIGTLLRLREKLKSKPYFALINGDSLFFPSDMQQIQAFKQEFLKSQCDGLFFVTPYKQNPIGRALYADSQQFLKKVEKPKNPEALKNPEELKNPKEAKNSEELKNPKKTESLKALKNSEETDLTPYAFTGLALFKSSLLDSLPASAPRHARPHRHSRESGNPFHFLPKMDFFQDFILRIANKVDKPKIKVFVDKSALLLEAGNKNSYLKSTEFCLNQLFHKEQFDKKKSKRNLPSSKETINPTKESLNPKSLHPSCQKILKEIFTRFDPKNQTVGFDKQNLDRWGYPALIPLSVKGIKNLKIKDFAILAPKTQLFGPSQLEKSVIATPTPFKGDISNELLIAVRFQQKTLG